jgi:hypothetical protein
MSPRRGSTPRLTDRLTVGRNATLTLTLVVVVVVVLLEYYYRVGELSRMEPIEKDGFRERSII